MKNIILAGFLFLALVSYTSAQSVNNKTITWEATDSNGKIRLIVKGEVGISEDDQRIVSLSKDGAINYEHRSDKLQVTSGYDGNLIYRFNKKEKTVLDAHEEQLLKKALQMMINHGIDAETRAKRLYAKSGRDGVLQELPKLQGDYARQKYLSALLSFGMSTAEKTEVLNNSGQYLTSDYYNAELLTNVMTIYLLDDATSKAYLNIVRNMKSDYYQYSILQKIMKNKLNSEQMVEVVDIVKTMKSDYYQSEVYKNLLKQGAFGETAFNETLDLVFSMKSDCYKTEIIKNLLKRQLTEANWTKLISYADKIDSNYYQCELILNIADKMPENDILKRGLLDAAKAIKSEYYYGKVMRKIAAS